jgi:hypothetical protein
MEVPIMENQGSWVNIGNRVTSSAAFRQPLVVVTLPRSYFQIACEEIPLVRAE